MFANHQTDAENRARPEGSVHDWVASLTKVWPESDGTIKAQAAVVDPAFKARLEELDKHGMLNDMGISIRAIGEASRSVIDGVKTDCVESLTAARSVDFVTFAGAGGRVEAMESARLREALPKSESFDALRERVAVALQNQIRIEANDVNCYCWVQDLYSDIVVYSQAGVLYQRNYAEDADGNITFAGAPVTVEMAYEPVGESSATDEDPVRAFANKNNCSEEAARSWLSSEGQKILARESRFLQQQSQEEGDMEQETFPLDGISEKWIREAAIEHCYDNAIATRFAKICRVAQRGRLTESESLFFAHESVKHLVTTATKRRQHEPSWKESKPVTVEG